MVKHAPRADAVRNRQRILAIAEATFASEGLGVSVDEVAARAGVGIGTLYRHFPTKDALFEAIVVERIAHSVAHAQALAESAAGEALPQLVRELVRNGEHKRDFVDALGARGFTFGPETTRMKDELRRAIGVLLGRAQAAGTIRKDVTAADIVALVRGIFASGEDARSRQRHLEIVLAGLRAH